MPVLDDDSNSIIVRIVYAGPPMAGKTKTIQSLAQLLLGGRAEGAVFSPGEAAHRTLYFDWLDYSGGLFKGRKVRCQIVTVPGQKALTERRQFILQSADVIVFVADSSPDRFDHTLDYLKEVQIATRKPDHEPAVGILLQVNKRDLPNALTMDEIKSRLVDFPELKMIETAATSGRGVREAFVKSVGLSLERVQTLMSSDGTLDTSLDFQGGEDLLAAIESQESARYTQPEPKAAKLASVAGKEDVRTQSSRLLKILSVGTLSASDSPSESEITTNKALEPNILPTPAPVDKPHPPIPWLPDANLPAGHIWPPITGRVVLHEISRNQSTPRYQQGGIWTLSAGDNWLLSSQSDQVFDNIDDGRRILLEHVRAHKSVEEFLSHNRCVALTAANEHQWRIWQIVRRERTLVDELCDALREINPVTIADKLFQIGGYVLHAAASMRLLPLVITPGLQSCSLINDKAVYSGFIYIHALNEGIPEPFTQDDITELIRNEFGLPIANRLNDGEMDVPLILTRLKQIQGKHPEDPVIDALSALFIGH